MIPVGQERSGPSCLMKIYVLWCQENQDHITFSFNCNPNKYCITLSLSLRDREPGAAGCQVLKLLITWCGDTQDSVTYTLHQPLKTGRVSHNPGRGRHSRWARVLEWLSRVSWIFADKKVLIDEMFVYYVITLAALNLEYFIIMSALSLVSAENASAINYVNFFSQHLN